MSTINLHFFSSNLQGCALPSMGGGQERLIETPVELKSGIFLLIFDSRCGRGITEGPFAHS